MPGLRERRRCHLGKGREWTFPGKSLRCLSRADFHKEALCPRTGVQQLRKAWAWEL